MNLPLSLPLSLSLYDLSLCCVLLCWLGLCSSSLWWTAAGRSTRASPPSWPTTATSTTSYESVGTRCARTHGGREIWVCAGGRPTSSRAWLPGDELVGIMAAKRVLNDLHYQMGQEGYDEMYLDLMGEWGLDIHHIHPSIICCGICCCCCCGICFIYAAEDLTVIQRHSPRTHSTIYFVIR